MAGINEYDTTAGNNSSINSINIAEGCAPSGINNAIRQLMADIRSQWNDANWFQYGDGAGTVSVTYASATSFTVDGVDVSSVYHVGRRIRAVGASTGTIYGTISAVAYVTDTTVTVTWDSGSLNNEALTISLSIIEATNTGIPSTTFNFGDNDKILFGNGNDLEIYHSGTHSFIDDVGTGGLYIQSNNLLLRSSAGERFLEATEDGSVQIFYDSSEKLATTTDGIDVTGTVTDDGATHDGDVTFTGAAYNVLWDKSDNRLEFGDNAKLSFGASSDLSIYHDASNSYIQETGAGGLIIDSSVLTVRNGGGTETQATFTQNGAVALYYNNSKKVETTSSGILVTGGIDMTATMGDLGTYGIVGLKPTDQGGSNITWSKGGTVAGSNLWPVKQLGDAGTSPSDGSTAGDAMSGTWRNMGGTNSTNTSSSNPQWRGFMGFRIA